VGSGASKVRRRRAQRDDHRPVEADGGVLVAGSQLWAQRSVSLLRPKVHTPPMPRVEQGRGLRAVVFLDTVGSTQIASELGDERWQTLLRRELQILRRLLKESGGREVDVAGDGLFALFDEPAAAVQFAASAVEAVREIGVEVRAGVHFGEVEFSDGHPAGIVVHTGARAMSIGDAGQVIVTQTLRALVSGGHLRFADRGSHELKGIPGSSPLYLLTEIDRDKVPLPLDEDEASSRREQASEPAPLVKRRTFLTGIGGVAVAGLAAAYLLTRQDTRRGKTVDPPLSTDNRLFRYVPDTDELTMMPGVYASGDYNPSIAVGEGAVWTGDFVLHHVDPDDGSEGDPIDLLVGGAVGGEFVYDIAIGFDDVWVTTGAGLHRIDPGDGEQLGFRALSMGRAGTVAIGFGGVWVGNGSGTLFRVEPSRTLPTLETLPVGAVVSGVVAAGGLIWVSDEFGALVPVDPSLNRMQEPVTVGGTPIGLAATSDRLWTVDSGGQSVTVVDFETRELLRSIPVGGKPVDVATGLGAVWVADSEGRIVRIDTTLLSAVHDKVVGGPVAALAIDEDNGEIWLRTGGSRPRN
jgi:class 3 adenylate cyclase/streptogramin lyase